VVTRLEWIPGLKEGKRERCLSPVEVTQGAEGDGEGDLTAPELSQGVVMESFIVGLGAVCWGGVALLCG